MRRFEVGQLVRVISSGNPERIGTIATIVAQCCRGCPEQPCWTLDFDVDGYGLAHYSQHSLELIDPYDGHETTTWDTLPVEVRRVFEKETT